MLLQKINLLLLLAKLKTPVADFIGTFGMPNLTKLKTILGFDVYNDDSADITMTKANKDGNEVPSAIHFATKNKVTLLMTIV